MPTSRGRYFRLSLPRRWIGDLLYFASKVPTVPVERTMELGEVQIMRERVGISWPALFLKAFGIAAQQHPELRYALIQHPWDRMYEHPFSVASVAIERIFQGEPAVFFGQIKAPECHTLESLDRELKGYKVKPVTSFGNFRRLIRMSRLPQWLRRFAWWLSLHWSGATRARRMGTFGFSVYASLGASSLHPLSPLSYLLNYGVIDELGRLTVRLVYDHRVVDGAVVARALSAMESALTGPLLDELIRCDNLQSGCKHEGKDAEDHFTQRRIQSLVSG